MSNVNVIEVIRQRVIDAANDPNNAFSPEAWDNHIRIVVQFSKILANKFEADLEIIELAALLHDIASLLNFEWVTDHHIYGEKIARHWLAELNYPQEKIDQVCHCILSHRGSLKIPRETIEADCVASADALSHIANFPSILRLALVSHKMTLKEAVPWSLNKIERSWNKITPEAKILVEDQYKAIQIMCAYII